MNGATRDRDRIVEVSWQDHAGVHTVRAKAFVDASGEGDLAFFADASTRYGNDGMVNLGTLGTRFGGMVTVILDTDLAGTRRFLENTHLFSLAESLGGVESLVNYPPIMTHGAIPEEKRIALGITESLVRLSVGVEDVEDLRDDLQTALAAI